MEFIVDLPHHDGHEEVKHNVTKRITGLRASVSIGDEVHVLKREPSVLMHLREHPPKMRRKPGMFEDGLALKEQTKLVESRRRQTEGLEQKSNVLVRSAQVDDELTDDRVEGRDGIDENDGRCLTVEFGILEEEARGVHSLLGATALETSTLGLEEVVLGIWDGSVADDFPNVFAQAVDQEDAPVRRRDANWPFAFVETEQIPSFPLDRFHEEQRGLHSDGQDLFREQLWIQLESAVRDGILADATIFGIAQHVLDGLKSDGIGHRRVGKGCSSGDLTPESLDNEVERIAGPPGLDFGEVLEEGLGVVLRRIEDVPVGILENGKRLDAGGKLSTDSCTKRADGEPEFSTSHGVGKLSLELKEVRFVPPDEPADDLGGPVHEGKVPKTSKLGLRDAEVSLTACDGEMNDAGGGSELFPNGEKDSALCSLDADDHVMGLL